MNHCIQKLKQNRSTFKLYFNHLCPKCHLTLYYFKKKQKNVMLYPVRNYGQIIMLIADVHEA